MNNKVVQRFKLPDRSGYEGQTMREKAQENITAQRPDGGLESRIATLEAENNRLRRSEAHYRAVFDSANGFAILTTDLNGIIDSWSPGAIDLLGWSEAEATGQHACMIFTPEDNAKNVCQQEMDTAAKKSRAEDERWHQRKDGSLFWSSGLMMRFEDEDTHEHIGYLKILRDRTSHHIANERIRESEELSRALFESSADCVKLLELDGTLHSINGPGLCLMEIDDFGAFAGTSWSELWPDAIKQDLESAVAEAKAGRSGRFEGDCPTAKGKQKSWDVVVSPVVDAKGEPRMLLSVSRDITERTKGQQALSESEARFRNMADHAPVMMWVTNAHGYCTYLNRRWYEFTGQTEAEAVGFGWLNATHKDDKDEAKRKFVDANADHEPFRSEYRLRRADGVYRWSIDAASPRFAEDGTFLGYVGSVIDIDDRHDMESALRHRTEQLQGLASAALVVARAPTLENTLENINEAAQRIIGAHQGVVSLTRGPDWSQAINAVTLSDKYSAWRDFTTMPEGEGIYAWLCEENRPARMTQRELELHPRWRGFGNHAAEHPPMRGWLAAPLVGRDGVNLGLIQLSDKEDGSDFDEADEAMLVQLAHFASAAVEQAQTEKELRDLNEFLEQRVADAIAERERTEEALRQSQKLEAMGSLTGGVAHDFNNLLTPIIGSLDMLLRRGVGSTRERQLMDGALQSADRAKTLVQRLLAFARRQPLQTRAVDIKGLVGGIAELIGSTTGPRVEVRLELPEHLPPATADANQLEMAVLNLALNARDAMPDGGRLTISASVAAILTEDKPELRSGNYVRLSVKDTGTGMDEMTQIRAIEPFFSTKGIGKGTGLGLSMVHGLASQLKGGLTIFSQPGEGTTIDLWLPVSPYAVIAGNQASVAPPEFEGNGVALVVDDEELVRMSTANMLSDLGYDVVETASAEQAISLISDGLTPVLLVTDHLMPGMNGCELANHLKLMTPNLPVLIVSGYAEADGIDPDLPRLTKPFRITELAESLTAI
jgi:PAS domain S-box-containing protein